MPELQPETSEVRMHLLPHEELHTLEQQVVGLNYKNIKVETQLISVCHILTQKEKTKPTIVVQFFSRT